MVLNRSPTDEEVDAEVAKERARQSEEKRKGPADYGRSIDEISSRVADLETGFSSLREDVTASVKRVEDLIKQVMGKWSLKEGNTGQENMERSTSTTVLGTSVPTSHTQENMDPSTAMKVIGTLVLTTPTQEAWQVVEKDFLLPMLSRSGPPIEATPPIATGDINTNNVVSPDVEKNKEPVNPDVEKDQELVNPNVTDNATTGGETQEPPREELPEVVQVVEGGDGDEQEALVQSSENPEVPKSTGEPEEAGAEEVRVASTPF